MVGRPFVSRATTLRATRLPARSRNLALQPASRKGVPCSALRFDPGTPFLDHNIYRCLWRGQMQSGERERAGSSSLTGVNDNHTRLIGKWTSVANMAAAVGAVKAGEHGPGSWGLPVARSGRRCRTWRDRVRALETKRLRPHRGVSLLRFLHGCWVAR